MQQSFFSSQFNNNKKNYFAQEFAEMDRFFHTQVVMNCRIRDKKSGSGPAEKVWIRINNTGWPNGS
jgi:hypothetical protein